ncbi:MAG: hypothetical protein JWP02_2855 [Acidimicrobiales bacterium]|jgi:hypothetical protein|nr:hypothetical protein [Acidimicrobiales bacterium]
MTTPAKCDKHLFEDATGMCRTCRRPYCDDCLVFTQGAKRAPMCVPCALTAAGVRSTAASRSQRGSIGVAGKLLVGMASTAAAAAVAIPALSHLH